MNDLNRTLIRPPDVKGEIIPLTENEIDSVPLHKY